VQPLRCLSFMLTLISGRCIIYLMMLNCYTPSCRQTKSAFYGAMLFFSSFGPYFVEPVIAGIDPVTLEPFVANLDLIGCPMVATDFAVSGTCTEQMYGMCESLWVPDMVQQLYQSYDT